MNNLEPQTTDQQIQQNKNIKEAEKAQTFFDIVYSQFKDHKAAVIGGYIIIFFMLIALLAPVLETITGNEVDRQNVFNRYKPPFSRIIASQDIKETSIQNFVRQFPEDAKLIEAELISKSLVQPIRPEDALYDWVALEKTKALEIAEKIESSPKSKELIAIASSFESFHLFGTDELGRDVLMRLVY